MKRRPQPQQPIPSSQPQGKQVGSLSKETKTAIKFMIASFNIIHRKHLEESFLKLRLITSKKQQKH